jgi:t-SNARE complex subunit (syntaxin)
MIRVGQMAFAEIIKEHKEIKTLEEMSEVIEMFNDFDIASPFSIQNISKIARR